MIRKHIELILFPQSVLVPGKIKWLENWTVSCLQWKSVLVPGKIKWLENFVVCTVAGHPVLVPGKIKWLENFDDLNSFSFRF